MVSVKIPCCCHIIIHVSLAYAKDIPQGHLLEPYPITSTMGLRLDAWSGRIGFLPII